LSQTKLAKQAVVYDKLELLLPDRRVELFEDLTQRIGIQPADVKIGKIDLEKASATLTIYFDREETRAVDESSEQST